MKNKSEFTKIYLLHFDSLCRYAFRFFPDKEEASDIVQSIMLKLWEQNEKIQEIEEIQKYLFRTVHNVCINKIEHLKIKENHSLSKMNDLRRIELDDFEQAFHQWEMRDKLNTEINQLTPKAKEVFELRYYDTMSYKEIAQQLNISERTVETHLQNALKTLRDKLKFFFNQTK